MDRFFLSKFNCFVVLVLFGTGLCQTVPLIDSAYAYDADGNGYFDRIVVRYNRIVTFAKGFVASEWIGVNSLDGQEFKVDSVAGTAAQDVTDSVATVFFHALENMVHRTDWWLYIFITGPENKSSMSGARPADRAGPVLLQAAKRMYAVSDRTRDLVVVAFSEPVSTVGSPSFSLSMQPGLVFDVWKKVGDTLVRQDSMLAGITSFYDISADSTQAAFYMTNGKDLSTNYLLSLKTAPPGITDKAVSKNPPAGNNQKVRVQVMVESSTQMPNIVLGLRNPFIVRFDSFGKQVFVRTANNAKNATVKIALFSLNGKMLFSSQAMTNTWTSLPPATNSIRIIKIEAGGRTICTKVGLF